MMAMDGHDPLCTADTLIPCYGPDYYCRRCDQIIRVRADDRHHLAIGFPRDLILPSLTISPLPHWQQPQLKGLFS